MPQLGDALRTPPDRPTSRSSYRIYETDPAPLPSTDPYERLRRVASRPPRRVQFDDEPGALDYEDSHGESAPLPPLPPIASRSRRQSLGSRGTTQPYPEERRSPVRPSTVALSTAIATRSDEERMLGGAVTLGVVSALLMAVTVAARLSSVPDWIPIHIDAAGNVNRWGTDATLWRLPLFALMATIVWALITWFVARKEAVAIKLGLVVTVLTQTLCWIALLNLAW